MVPGVISLVQNFGSLAHWHRYLHVIVTAGALRRALLALFVRAGWLEADAASPMLRWPQLGFSAHVGPRIEVADRASMLRVARSGALAPVAESRLRYDAERAEVELVSNASEGPYAGVHRFAVLEFLARRVDHIAGQGEVRVRDYGATASRRRGGVARGRGARGRARYGARGGAVAGAPGATAAQGVGGRLSRDGVRWVGRSV